MSTAHVSKAKRQFSDSRVGWLSSKRCLTRWSFERVDNHLTELFLPPPYLTNIVIRALIETSARSSVTIAVISHQISFHLHPSSRPQQAYGFRRYNLQASEPSSRCSVDSRRFSPSRAGRRRPVGHCRSVYSRCIEQTLDQIRNSLRH